MTATLFRACFVAVSCLVAIPALAETIALQAELKPQNQVPAINGNPASGNCSVGFEAQSKMLSWTCSYSGMTGKALAGHFHGPADATKTAGVVITLPKIDSPFEDKATLTDAQAAELLAGKWYVNIHTAAHPGGEIRGQVVKAK